MPRPIHCFPQLLILREESIPFGFKCFVLPLLAFVCLLLAFVLPLLLFVRLLLAFVLPLLLFVRLLLAFVFPLLLFVRLLLAFVFPLLLFVRLLLAFVLPLLAFVLGSFSRVPTPLPFLDLSPDCSCNHHQEPSYLHCSPRYQRRGVYHVSERLVC